mmetsp:Transcript_25725/g.67333  ORF Transcript_25725/g.67333 Transcript_25725/m.67333 type:complete len:152 (-) Transcript_25725:957-1412(-)
MPRWESERSTGSNTEKCIEVVHKQCDQQSMLERVEPPTLRLATDSITIPAWAVTVSVSGGHLRTICHLLMPKLHVGLPHHHKFFAVPKHAQIRPSSERGSQALWDLFHQRRQPSTSGTSATWRGIVPGCEAGHSAFGNPNLTTLDSSLGAS